jgi:hypothetical protein
MHRKSWSWRGVAAGLLLVGVGCSTRPVPVEGLVSLDGRPLKNAAVTFIPEGNGRIATAITGNDGSFHLTTFAAGDGALPGDYKVTITFLPPPGSEKDVVKPPTNDQEFLQMMQRDVRRGKYAAQQAAKRERLNKGPNAPKEVYRDLSKTPLKCRVPTSGKVTFALEGEPGK